MKKKVVFVIYRKWAFDIVRQIFDFKKTHDFFEVPAIITTPVHEFDLAEAKKLTNTFLLSGKDNEGILRILKAVKADVVFFYGWSWIVSREIADNLLCMVHHPSPLPRYRGGTPIQHQILNNEKTSAVTVFKMTQGMDDGDIYMQLPMSLSGDINNIFARMVNLGVRITKKFLRDLRKNSLKFTPQKNLDRYPPNKRRKPQDSEIILTHALNKCYKDIYNLIRGLLDPFPNAFIALPHGRILVQRVRKASILPKTGLVLNAGTDYNVNALPGQKLFIKLKDGFAQLMEYKIIAL